MRGVVLPRGEHVRQHVFGDLFAADFELVTGILHLGQALTQREQLTGDLARARVA